LPWGGAVERLPSGEGGGFRKCSGQRGSVSTGAVAEQAVDLIDLRSELIEQSDAAEAPVDVAGVVDLLAEEVDSLTIDRAGEGESGP
jgi:hypothetical protein